MAVSRVAISGVAVALLVAAAIRSGPLFSTFPLGDGGLFWVMAGDLRASGFAPPETTGYNGGEIPWIYPPIGISLLALLGGGLEWLRFLPAAFAIATIPAVWLLARALVGERAALVAAAAYGLAPSAYDGLITGGGVTRAPGVLLAVLTMWAVADRRPLAAGVLGGLTLLTHPLAAFYGALGAAVLWLTRRPDRRMLLALPVALVIGAAWFGPMALRHGVEPLLGGLGSRGGPDLPGSALLLVSLALNPPTLAVTGGVVGAVIAWRRRRWDLLAWLAVTALGVGVVGRWAVIPLAVLAGLAVDATLAHVRRPAAVAFLGIAVATAVIGVLLASPPGPLTTDERATIDWVRAEADARATVAIIGYPADGGMVEWFPALAERASVTTAQGSEWVPGGLGWDEAWEASRCRDLACLPAADLYVLRPGCCAELAAAMTPIGPDAFVRRP